MAAPTGNVRIRLSFSNLDGFPAQKPLKSWFMINFKYLDTILDFEAELRRRFELVCNQELVLQLDGYVLPSWESVQLLRDGDEVRVSGCQNLSSDLSLPSARPVTTQKTLPSALSKAESLLQEATVETEDEDSSSDSDSSESSTSDDVLEVPKCASSKSVAPKSSVVPKDTVKRPAPSPSPSSVESEEVVLPSKEESVNIVTIAVKSPEKDAGEEAMETNTSHEPKKRCRNRRRGRGKKGNSEEKAAPAPVASDKSVTVTEYPWSKGNARGNEFFSLPKNKRARPDKQTNGQHKHIRFNSESEEEGSPPETQAPPLTQDDHSVPSFAKEVAQNPTPTFMSSTPLDPHPKGRKKKGVFADVQVFKRNRNRANDTVSDISVIPAENGNQHKASAPRVECLVKDYLGHPVLKDVSGIPRAGDHIAFKIVEMTENYTPEVSSYKEARVLSYNPTQGSVTVQLLTSNGDKKKLGRFDITLETEGEILTNVESEDENQMTVQFTSMLDCRLLS